MRSHVSSKRNSALAGRQEHASGTMTTSLPPHTWNAKPLPAILDGRNQTASLSLANLMASIIVMVPTPQAHCSFYEFLNQCRRDIGPFDVGALEAGPFEAGASEVRASEVGASEVGASEAGVA